MSAKQKASIREADGRVNVWEGAVRSGKTYSSVLAYLTKLAHDPAGGEFLITGKNRDSIHRNFFQTINKADGLRAFRSVVDYRAGAPTARILGHTVHVIGANDASSESRIRGATVRLAYADELTVLDRGFVKQLLARMSPPGAQLLATTNPDGPRHWLKTEYLDRIDKGELPDWRRWRFTMDDNPSLTQEYRNSLAREYTGLWHRRFIQGEWVAAEGAIYADLDLTPGTGHVIPWANTPPIREWVGIGLDHGTTNPTVAILLGITDEPTPRLIAVDEWAHQPDRDGGQLSDVEQSRRFRAWLGQEHTPHTRQPAAPRIIYADPAAASFRKQLRDDKTPARTARNEVVDGIRTVASLVSTRRLVITDRCRTLLDEMPGYAWDTKATDDGRDAPVKENDHACDALRYVVHSAAYSWRKHLR